MTYKLHKLVEGIKEDIKLNSNKSIKDIAITKAGYSLKARNMYRPNTKRHILEELSKLGFSKEELQKRFQLGSELALKKGDFTNYLRANEDIARMEGQFLDKSEVNNKNDVAKIVIVYPSNVNKPVDNSNNEDVKNVNNSDIEPIANKEVI